MASFRGVLAALSRTHITRRLYSIPPSTFNQPLSGDKLTRAGGLCTMFRLPLHEGEPSGLDACFVGVPMDTGCNYRSGTRLGPRAIRNESVLIRYMNMTGALPFESLQVADIGDVPVIPYNLERSHQVIEEYFGKIVGAGCVPLTVGGDHSLTYPVLKALHKKHGPMGLVQVDAHPDLCHSLSGERLANGTVIRRALEDGLLDPKNMVQIGLRGSMEAGDLKSQFEWAQEQGIKQVFATQCWHKSLAPLMEKVRAQFKDIPTYFTFDMDGIDPTNCPGAGTLEAAGLTPIQAIEIIRGLKGMNIIGGDLAETNPLNDPGGITALTGANMMFELLCILPGVKYTNIDHIFKNDLMD